MRWGDCNSACRRRYCLYEVLAYATYVWYRFLSFILRSIADDPSPPSRVFPTS